jgi:crotonobetainyl-CoA:carnitine CoA-transferase CaiB-like acyl-CoA transferase
MGSILSETPVEMNKAAPVLGQDNLQVYTQILGLSEEEFIDLMQQGVFE